MRNALGRLCVAALLPMILTGCVSSFGPKAANGITFYSPGAGNVDFGDQGIRRGLENAGYQGQVATVMWTFSFNPAFDQVVRGNALLGANELAKKIQQYIDKYPGKPLSLVGLSAGTGVTIWALEALKPGYKVDNVVLLSSSLSSDYDISKALEHVSGSVYNYYSPQDAVLTVLMAPFGTIDGKLGADGAGAVGLHPKSGGDRVVNIRWRREYERYGYYGHHTDSTSPKFVQAVLSKHLLKHPTGDAPSDGALASSQESTPPAANSD